MGVENVLTVYLSGLFDEVSSADFYGDLFSLCDLPTKLFEEGKYSPIMVRVRKGADGAEHAERKVLIQDLSSVQTDLDFDLRSSAQVLDLVSPVSYAGRRPLLRAAHELFALVFDLDGVKIENGEPVGLKDLLHQATQHYYEGNPIDQFLPMPTYIVSSGTGLHLYYLLDTPIRMWPNVCERLRKFRDAFTKRCWNQYVTDLSKEAQLEGVVQAFRMVGSLAKDGQQIVRAFKTGERVSIDFMNKFVPDDCKVTPDLFMPSMSLSEALEAYPGWDPAWRSKAAQPPHPTRLWRIKRDLFDWWCRRVEAGECFEGNRYWCIFVAAAYAAKCPDVTYEELEEWALKVRPALDRITSNEHNHFTAEDVYAALAVYGNPLSPLLRREKVAEKTQLPMPVNKRNGRKQALHLRMARSNLEILNEDAGKALQGRPKGSGTAAFKVWQYAKDHPESSQREIAKALGISPTTVNKWLKVPNWRDELEHAVLEALYQEISAYEQEVTRRFGSIEDMISFEDIFSGKVDDEVLRKLGFLS